MKKLYLLRHGQTEFNVKKLVQGRCDSPLTDLGRQQAGMAAAWLKAHGVVPDKVVSSPLGRAMDTASLVACELLGPDAAVEPCEGIIERCYGTFEEGPHDALPTDVWDPGEDLVPFGGEGSRALQERRKEYIEAAQNLGFPAWRIMLRHLLPNCLGPVMVFATIQIANAIVLEATLSFLGVGVPITEPSLGLLIANGFQYLLSGDYWISMFPGLALLLLILAINVIADRLRAALDPRSP